MFEKLSCTLAVLLRMFWKRCIRLTGKASDGNHRQRAQCEVLAPSFPQLLAKEIPLQMALAHHSHTQLLFLSRSYQRLFYGGLRVSPFGGWCCLWLQSVPCDRSVGWFSLGCKLFQVATHILMNISALALAMLALCVPLYETMHNEYCPCPSPNKHRMPLWFIYFWNPCQPGENTADCTLQQFSGILQSHFISFSSLNPMTLTQLTLLIENYDFLIL